MKKWNPDRLMWIVVGAEVLILIAFIIILAILMG